MQFVKVEDLKEGDLVDLSGDKYGDSNADRRNRTRDDGLCPGRFRG